MVAKRHEAYKLQRILTHVQIRRTNDSKQVHDLPTISNGLYINLRISDDEHKSFPPDALTTLQYN